VLSTGNPAGLAAETRGVKLPLFRVLALCVAFSIGPATAPILAQQAPVSKPVPAPADEDTLVLSPFEVHSSQDVGYVATSSLAGGRTEMSLKQTAAAISVFTREFLDDIGGESLTSVAMWGLNMARRQHRPAMGVYRQLPRPGQQLPQPQLLRLVCGFRQLRDGAL
jgi:hypothetical protein